MHVYDKNGGMCLILQLQITMYTCTEGPHHPAAES